MEIPALSGSFAAQAPKDLDRQVAVMKKARDIETSSAEALLELVKQAPTGDVGRLISVRA